MSKALFQIAALAVLLIGSSLIEAFLPFAIYAASPGDTDRTSIMPANEKGTMYGWQKCEADYWETSGPYASPEKAYETCHERIAVFFHNGLRVEGQAFSGDDCTNTAGEHKVGSFRATITNISEDTVVTSAQISMSNGTVDMVRAGAISGWLTPGQEVTSCIDVWDKAFDTVADYELFYSRLELTQFSARNIQGITLAERAYPR